MYAGTWVWLDCGACACAYYNNILSLEYNISRLDVMSCAFAVTTGVRTCGWPDDTHTGACTVWVGRMGRRLTQVGSA